MKREELVAIVEKASTLRERLNGGFDAVRRESNEYEAGLIAKRWEEWRRYTNAQDDQELLETVNTSLSSHEVQRLLGDVRLRDGEMLPDWALTLDEFIQSIIQNTDVRPPRQGRQLISCKPYPFEDLFLPVLEMAYDKLEQQAPNISLSFTNEACADLMERLLAELSELCGRTLMVDFAVFRVTHFQNQGFMTAFTDEPSAAAYSAYMTAMRQGRVVDFFKQYSFLARLAATRFQYWLSSASELSRRLAEDHDGLAAGYGVFGPVERLKWGLSDSHQQGRTVAVLEFNEKRKIVYKPKSLAIDQAFGQLAEWMRERAVPVKFRVPKVWSRGVYGWAEYIENSSCRDASEIGAYYRHFGGLVCLVYLLGGIDFHDENIVAASDLPVLIDLETLLHPLWNKPPRLLEEEREKDDAEHRELMKSVFASYLLPYHDHKHSGLFGWRKQGGSISKLEWKHINLDNMKIEEQLGDPHPTCTNFPMLDDQVQKVHAYIPELLEGFRQTAQFIIKNKELMLRDKVIDLFHDVHGRALFRSTFKYQMLLNKMLHPENLREGITASIKLETLSRIYISDKVPQLLSLIDTEVKQLGGGDIPYFTISTNAGQLDIFTGDKKSDCSTLPLAQSSLERVFTRLEQWNERDIHHQSVMMEEAVKAAIMDPEGLASISMLEQAPLKRTTDELRDLVWKLADHIRRRSFYRPDPSSIWIVPGIETSSQSFQFHPMGYGMYDGVMGVALFLMAAGKMLEEDDFIQLSIKLVDPVRQLVRGDRVTSRFLGIGAASGWASLVYGWTQLSRLSGDDKLLEDAAQAARFITPERIARDDQLDVMYGSAGVIASLLTLYSETRHDWLLKITTCAGERLLLARKLTHTGHLAWLHCDHKFALTGFSHGTAGIAYALLRLYEATGMESFKDAAEEGLRYETAVFQAEQRNWPDFRSIPKLGEPSRFMNSWCHGAAGIGLARIGSWRFYRTASVIHDVEESILAVIEEPTSAIDHICCGNFGRIELLIAASQTLNRPHLAEIAFDKTISALNGRTDSLGCMFARNQQSASKIVAHDNSLFQGISGIGYTLLRLCDVLEHREPIAPILLFK